MPTIFYVAYLKKNYNNNYNNNYKIKMGKFDSTILSNVKL